MRTRVEQKWVPWFAAPAATTRAAVSIALLLSLAPPVARAFNGHVVREGPVTVTIDAVEDVTAYDAPREVRVTVGNAGAEPLKVRLRLAGLVDEWRAVGKTEQLVRADPGKEAQASFQIAAGKGAHSALYPVHVHAAFTHAGAERTAHAVQIFRSQFKRPLRSSATPEAMPQNVVPPLKVNGVYRLKLNWNSLRPNRQMPVVSLRRKSVSD